MLDVQEIITQIYCSRLCLPVKKISHLFFVYLTAKLLKYLTKKFLAMEYSIVLMTQWGDLCCVGIILLLLYAYGKHASIRFGDQHPPPPPNKILETNVYNNYANEVLQGFTVDANLAQNGSQEVFNFKLTFLWGMSPNPKEMVVFIVSYS